jgi:AsmA protein
MNLSPGAKRGMMVAAAIFLAMFLIRPGANRLRARLANSLGMSLGRQVEIGSVHLRLLPRPGFSLEQFVVRDDSSFSAEPVLRADEVTADLRLRALLHGRMEISSLSLKEPSLNLVRRPDGRWNIASVIERAAQTNRGPTGHTTAPARPQFPYIEADDGRINFKLGQEKKPYALTDADFSLWLESEDEWSMRLKGRPVRTDSNVTDTGILQVNGSWRRAPSLVEAPLDFQLALDGAQLGQLSKLFLGDDQGWRGGVSLNAALTGSPSRLSVAIQAAVQDFRRYDIMSGRSLRLAASCHASYSVNNQTISEISCQAPSGDGTIALNGELAGFPVPREFDLKISGNSVPMQSVVELARRVRKGLPDDLSASGTLTAEFAGQKIAGGEATWSGKGHTSNLTLRSEVLRMPLPLGEVPFFLGLDAAAGASRKSATKLTTRQQPAPEAFALTIGPTPVALGRPLSATVSGKIRRTGYQFTLDGEARVQRLLQVVRLIENGFGAPAADGTARVNLVAAGSWTSPAPPTISGTAQLRGLRAEVRGINEPIEVVSANLSLNEHEIRLQNMVASAGPTRWSGSLRRARGCVVPSDCLLKFELHTDQVSGEQLVGLFNPAPSRKPWYRWLTLSESAGTVPFAKFHATGSVSASRLVIHGVTATRVSSGVTIDNGKLRLIDLRGQVFGGEHFGEWQADFTKSPAAFTGAGSLDHVAPAQFEGTLRDDSRNSTATLLYRVSASGSNAADILASAAGTFDFDWRNGTLRRITLNRGALQMRRFFGQVTLAKGIFEIHDAKLETPAGTYVVAGTSSMSRRINLTLTRDASHAFSISGPLAAPRVVPLTTSDTQAALKP